MTVLFYIGLFLFLLLCAIVILVVLVQESKSLGLGASFGGDSGDSLFGTSTAEVLKKFTAWLGMIFAAACIVLSFWSETINQPETSAPTTMEESK